MTVDRTPTARKPRLRQLSRWVIVAALCLACLLVLFEPLLRDSDAWVSLPVHVHAVVEADYRAEGAAVPFISGAIVRAVIEDREPNSADLDERMALVTAAFQTPVPTITPPAGQPAPTAEPALETPPNGQPPVATTPGVSPTTVATGTVLPTVSPAFGSTGTRAPVGTATRTPTVTITRTPTRVPTIRPSPTFEPTATATATIRATATVTTTQTATSTATRTPTPTPSRTPTATHTATATATATDTATATETATPTHTPTPTDTATPTNTPTATATPGCSAPLTPDGVLPDGFVNDVIPPNHSTGVPLSTNTIVLFFNQPMLFDTTGGSVDRQEHYELRNKTTNILLAIESRTYDPTTYALTIRFSTEIGWQANTAYDLKVKPSLKNACGTSNLETILTFTTAGTSFAMDPYAATLAAIQSQPARSPMPVVAWLRQWFAWSGAYPERNFAQRSGAGW